MAASPIFPGDWINFLEAKVDFMTNSERIQQRLSVLREEYAKGEELLAGHEREANELRQQLLRISGAIQVLKELQNDDGSDN